MKRSSNLRHPRHSFFTRSILPHITVPTHTPNVPTNVPVNVSTNVSIYTNTYIYYIGDNSREILIKHLQS